MRCEAGEVIGLLLCLAEARHGEARVGAVMLVIDPPRPKIDSTWLPKSLVRRRGDRAEKGGGGGGGQK